MKILCLFFFGGVISCAEQPQKIPEPILVQTMDSLPIKISYHALKKKCEEYIDSFKAKKKFSVIECIDIVRISNTISINSLWEKDNIFLIYKDSLLNSYLDNMTDTLDVKAINRGLGYYSKKYNIDIGGQHQIRIATIE